MKLPKQAGVVERTVSSLFIAKDFAILSPQQMMVGDVVRRSQNTLSSLGDFISPPSEVSCFCCYPRFCFFRSCAVRCPADSIAGVWV